MFVAVLVSNNVEETRQLIHDPLVIFPVNRGRRPSEIVARAK
ncbi:hypothetical protein TGAMA5MH_05141 [Trichoderma gamsii]|uniref:Uncharacterized protein n=1 Tax=Trichoderma gamsii TaxID=398673 RepID=A0A2K0TA43_9HYPO|nr:hypothetical protein TGAMA5MH_05141 [Trichoderma gamsii]